jgi:serine/threonine protein kinase
MEWNQYLIQMPSIARGSFSKVYYGIHKDTKIEIALKKIWFHSLSDSIKDKIISEIHILQQMNHPHVLKMKEYKCNGEYIFIITEYCNQTLEKWLDTKPSMDDKMNKITQIVSGIKYMHNHQIIHRDLKIQNILLHQGIIKICDFGFTKQVEENQLCHSMCGTPLYMSPELLQGKPYSFSSDIWSLGIICFQIIHGRHPFGKPSDLQEYRATIHNAITFPPFYEPFHSLLKSMLHVDPNQRPTADVIHSILNEESDDEEDVTGRGKTNRGYDQVQIHTEYFTPPDLPPTPPLHPIPITKPSFINQLCSFFK